VTSKCNPAQQLSSTVALLDAHDRLCKGCGTATSGKPTITNVAREAGVSRATAYRCPELLALLSKKIEPTKPSSKNVSSGSAGLRSTIDSLLNRIVILEAALTDKDLQIQRLRSVLQEVET
jgi:hypothetical protein